MGLNERINEMKHKYIALTEISNDTLKEFQFKTIREELPDFKLKVTRHENLKRIESDEDLRKSILIGICEVIVGTHVMRGMQPNDQQLLDIPSDFGRSGKFEADFSEPKTVRILNLFGGSQISSEII